MLQSTESQGGHSYTPNGRGAEHCYFARRPRFLLSPATMDVSRLASTAVRMVFLSASTSQTDFVFARTQNKKPSDADVLGTSALRGVTQLFLEHCPGIWVEPRHLAVRSAVRSHAATGGGGSGPLEAVNALQAMMNQAKKAKAQTQQVTEERQQAAWLQEQNKAYGEYPVLGATPYTQQAATVAEMGRGELEDLNYAVHARTASHARTHTRTHTQKLHNNRIDTVNGVARVKLGPIHTMSFRGAGAT